MIAIQSVPSLMNRRSFCPSTKIHRVLSASSWADFVNLAFVTTMQPKPPSPGAWRSHTWNQIAYQLTVALCRHGALLTQPVHCVNVS